MRRKTGVFVVLGATLRKLAVTVQNDSRKSFLQASLGFSAAALAGCAVGPGATSLLAPSLSRGGRATQTIGDDGANYTTSHDTNGNSFLYRNGALIAQLSTDLVTFETTTLNFFPTGFTASTAPPASTPTVGGTYMPYGDIVCSFPNSYQSNFTGSTSGAGYYTTASDLSTWTMANNRLWTSPRTETYGNGGIDKCGTKTCYAPVRQPAGLMTRGGLHTMVTMNCVVEVAFALGATVAFIGAVIAAIANPMFGIVEAGFLAFEHGLALATITRAVYTCSH